MSASAIVPYAGRRAVLATMHGKEAAVAPVFRARLGLTVATAPDLDTDALGTFTGEIPRAGTMREAAIAKARLGMAATGVPIGIASEGAYGPHPSAPFLPGGVEIMVLIDDARGIVVSESLIDDAPVFNHILTPQTDAIGWFLVQVGFPRQALIVRANEAGGFGAPIRKGLRTIDALTSAIAECAARSRDGHALVQTDMRAHMNPTRMATLARLACLLSNRLAARCPACASPGYGQTDVETGLPCEWCGAPSIMVRHQIFGCVACEHREMRPRSDGLTHADPGRCPECNP